MSLCVPRLATRTVLTQIEYLLYRDSDILGKINK